MVDEMEEKPRQSIRRRCDRRGPGGARHGVLPGESKADASRSSKPLIRSALRGAAAGTRSCSSRRVGTTAFLVSRSQATPTVTPGATRSSATSSDYASTFDLPVELNSPVKSVAPADGGFVLDLGTRTLESEQVVVATGPFQVPNVPAFAADLAPDVAQMPSTGYRRPSDVPPGTALVVGGGNTGFQIAEELSATHSVHLAVGSRQTPLPQRVLGRDVFWWLTKTGLINKTVDSRIGRLAQRRETLVGLSPRAAKRHGVEIKPRVVGASGRTVTFADGSELEVDGVIWATGYRSDYDWIDVPVFGQDGRVRHRRGVTDYPGLFFLGLYWQYTRGSALLGWVKDDAEFISEHIAANADNRTAVHAGVESEAAATPRGA